MFDLETAVTVWKDDALRLEPSLGSMAEEVADHLFSTVETQIAAGVDPEVAFADAVTRVGQPAALAEELRQAKHPMRRLYDTVALDPTGANQGRFIATAHIVTALFWAAIMVFLDGGNYALAGFFGLTFMPLIMLTTKLERFKAKHTNLS